MDFGILLGFLLLVGFIVLAVLGIVALLSARGDDAHSPSRQARSSWRKTVYKMLVLDPWPYKDLRDPYRRPGIVFPTDQPNNRAGRRSQRRGRKR